MKRLAIVAAAAGLLLATSAMANPLAVGGSPAAPLRAVDPGGPPGGHRGGPPGGHPGGPPGGHGFIFMAATASARVVTNWSRRSRLRSRRPWLRPGRPRLWSWRSRLGPGRSRLRARQAARSCAPRLPLGAAPPSGRLVLPAVGLRRIPARAFLGSGILDDHMATSDCTPRLTATSGCATATMPCSSTPAAKVVDAEYGILTEA